MANGMKCRVVYRFDTGNFFGIGIDIPYYTDTGWSVFRSVFPGVSKISAGVMV